MDIYVWEDGQQGGPFTRDQIAEFARTGALTDMAKVWHEGMQDWAPIGDILQTPVETARQPIPIRPVTKELRAPKHSPEGGSEDSMCASVPSPQATSAATLGALTDVARKISTSREAVVGFDLLWRSLTDTAKTISTSLTNPVPGVRQNFFAMGPPRALAAGLICIGACALSIAWSFDSLIPRWMRSGGGNHGSMVLYACIPAACLVATCAAVRKIARATGSFSHDAYVGGTSFVPLACACLASGLLGFRNIEMILVLAIFALVTSILLLWTGLTRIYELPERIAALAVPAMLCTCAWLTKVLTMSLF